MSGLSPKHAGLRTTAPACQGKDFAWGTQVTRDNVAFEFQEAKYANLVVDQQQQQQ